MVSLDTAHAVGSVKTLNTDPSIEEMLVAFELVGETLQGSKWQPSQIAESVSAVNELDTIPDVLQMDHTERQKSRSDYGPLGEFLYGLENLRKRRGQVGDDGEDDEAGEEPTEAVE